MKYRNTITLLVILALTVVGCSGSSDTTEDKNVNADVKQGSLPAGLEGGAAAGGGAPQAGGGAPQAGGGSAAAPSSAP